MKYFQFYVQILHRYILYIYIKYLGTRFHSGRFDQKFPVLNPIQDLTKNTLHIF